MWIRASPQDWQRIVGCTWVLYVSLELMKIIKGRVFEEEAKPVALPLTTSPHRHRNKLSDI